MVIDFLFNLRKEYAIMRYNLVIYMRNTIGHLGKDIVLFLINMVIHSFINRKLNSYT